MVKSDARPCAETPADDRDADGTSCNADELAPRRPPGASPVNLEKLGELFGQLHIHGTEWKPPPGFTTRRFDQIFARG